LRRAANCRTRSGPLSPASSDSRGDRGAEAALRREHGAVGGRAGPGAEKTPRPTLACATRSSVATSSPRTSTSTPGAQAARCRSSRRRTVCPTASSPASSRPRARGSLEPASCARPSARASRVGAFDASGLAPEAVEPALHLLDIWHQRRRRQRPRAFPRCSRRSGSRACASSPDAAGSDRPRGSARRWSMKVHPPAGPAHLPAARLRLPRERALPAGHLAPRRERRGARRPRDWSERTADPAALPGPPGRPATARPGAALPRVGARLAVLDETLLLFVASRRGRACRRSSAARCPFLLGGRT
jgi:hypothetical protein